MVKKVTLMLMLAVLGLICWTVMDVQAQQSGGGAGGFQMQQMTAAELLPFLKANGFTADAAKLEALSKDPAKKAELDTTLADFNRKYGLVARFADMNPDMAKPMIERLKIESAVEVAVAEAKKATDKAAATKKVTDQVGKLFDYVLNQLSAPPNAPPGGGGGGFAPQPTPKATLDAWKKNKDSIVKYHVDELMLDCPPFPWVAQGGMRRGGQ